MSIALRKLVAFGIFLAPTFAQFLDSGDCCSRVGITYIDVVSPVTLSDTGALYWSAQASALVPGCIVHPKDTTEVATVVSTLTKNNCTFAVRGGGHTFWAGSASIGSQGVVISLDYLNSVNIAASTVQIGGGATWNKVYNVLDPANLAVPGGRVVDVGVGGLTLGGGNSFYTARKGFVCDNVQNYTIVLGNGTVINANNETYSDLFKALKGGTNNFGVVTEFEMFTLPQNDYWGGAVNYNMTLTGDQQIQDFVAFTDNLRNDPYAEMESFWYFRNDESELLDTIQNTYHYTGAYNGTSATAATVYPPSHVNFTPQALPQLANQGNFKLRVSKMSDFVYDLQVANGGRYTYSPLTFNNTVETITKVRDVMQANFNETKGGNDGVHGYTFYSMVLQPFPSIYWENSVKMGGNSLGLERNTQNLVLFDLEIHWQNETFDDAINALNQKIITEIKQSIGDALNEYIYLNYANPQFQDPLAGYGPTNLNTLKQVAQKYDPAQIFQINVPGGFKLRTA